MTTGLDHIGITAWGLQQCHLAICSHTSGGYPVPVPGKNSITQ